MIKRVMSMALALMLVIGCFAGVTVSAEEASYEAGLGLVASDWSAQTGFGAASSVKTTVTGDGTYTLTYEGACKDLGILVVDIVGAQTALDAENKTYEVSDIALTIDGNAVTVDASKVLCGDLEKNGNFRIDLYNMYGDSKNDPCLDNTIAVTTGLSLSFKLTTVEKKTGASFDAGLGLVASDWSAQTGFGAESTVKTTVTGDGTYTLTYEGACKDLGILVVDIVGAQAALDAENKTYEVSDIALTIDGNAVAVDASKVLCGDLEKNGNFRIDLYNMYGDSKNDPCLDNTIAVTTGLSLSFKLTTVEKKAEGGESGDVPTEFEAFVAYGGDKAVENDWGVQYYGADAEGITAVKETIKVGETKTISLTFAEPSVNAWFFAPCMIADGVANIKTLDFTITCKINGEEVAIDMAADAEGKTWWTEDTGDYKGNCIRLAGGYNEWATRYIAEPSNITSIEYTITLNAVSDKVEGGEVDTPVEPEGPTFDPKGSYNAYLLLQTPNWTYRNAWNDTNGGLDSEFWGSALYGNETKEWYGKITDAVLAGNGTYTIEITDFGTIFEDDFATAGQDYFNIIGFSTDAPLGGLTFTDVKLIVDGSTKHKQAEGYQDPDSTDYSKILIQNKWNDDVKEISYYPAPTKSLKIEFTVSGFSYDKAAEEKPDDNKGDTTPTAPEATQPKADDSANESGSMTGVLIAVVAVAAVAAAVVVVIVIKKKKN